MALLLFPPDVGLVFLHLRLDMRHIHFDLLTKFEFGPDPAQFLIDGLNFCRDLSPFPFLLVSFFSLFGQTVDLGLQGVRQHGKLCAVINAIFLQQSELPLITP